MGAARSAMQLSCRPAADRVTFSIRSMSTVSCGLHMVGVGLKVTVNSTGMPLVMPPLMPPLWLVAVHTVLPLVRRGSLA